jgi:hypothetical protein
MKTNWIKTVNEINRKRFTIPEGWETRDQVADNLQCDPDKVGDMLKPGIQAGDIERQEFPVWDESRRMAIRVVCYRLAGEKKAPAVKPAARSASVDPIASIEARIETALLKYPKKSNYEIAHNIKSCTSGMVGVVRARMGKK